MLEIHHSNRLEVLLEHLVAVLDQPLPDPFAEEFLVVQNQGMARWLAQGLALRTGIAANLRFPLPARLVWDLLGCWFTELPEQSDWDKDRLVWRIFARLPGLLTDPDFAEPARYLQGEPRELKTYQLARRVADLFDQYLVYRPDVVLGWEQGPADRSNRVRTGRITGRPVSGACWQGRSRRPTGRPCLPAWTRPCGMGPRPRHPCLSGSWSSHPRPCRPSTAVS